MNLLLINKFRFLFSIFILVLFLQFLYISNDIKFFFQITSIILITLFYVLLFKLKIFKAEISIISIQFFFILLLNFILFLSSNLNTEIGFIEFFNDKWIFLLLNIFIATGFGLFYSNTCDKKFLIFVFKILTLLSFFLLPFLFNSFSITHYNIYHFEFLNQNNYSQQLSEFFAYMLILSFANFFFVKKNSSIFFLILLNFHLLIISGGRGAILFSLLIIFFLVLKKKDYLISKFFIISLLIFLYFFYEETLMGAYRVTQTFYSSQGRIDIYENFLEFIKEENCIIFGCGYRGLSLVDLTYNTFHNIIFEFISSLGLFITFFLFLFSFLGFVRFYKKYGLYNWFNLLFIFKFLQSLKSFDFFNSYLIINFGIFFLSYFLCTIHNNKIGYLKSN